MVEIRKDYFLDRWSLISPKRAVRPHDYRFSISGAVPPDQDCVISASCPFCPGMEHETPPAHLILYPNLDTGEIEETKDKIDDNERRKKWGIRVFANRYPAVDHTESLHKVCHDLLCAQPGYGYHEVVVETPNYSPVVVTFLAL